MVNANLSRSITGTIFCLPSAKQRRRLLVRQLQEAKEKKYRSSGFCKKGARAIETDIRQATSRLKQDSNRLNVEQVVINKSQDKIHNQVEQKKPTFTASAYEANNTFQSQRIITGKDKDFLSAKKDAGRK